MVPNHHVLFDLNVLLDLLQDRAPFYKSSAQALALAERESISGFIASHHVTTLFYLLAKNSSTSELPTTEVVSF